MIDDTLQNAFNELLNNAVDDLKKQYEDIFKFNDEVKYTNTLNYIDFANKILNSMGDIIFIIEFPRKESDYFLLPDFGAATIREKINEYFNPDLKEIAYIGFPLSSKIYLHFYSSKLSKRPISSKIDRLTSMQVFALNKANYDYSNQFVACESKEYLENFIKNVV